MKAKKIIALVGAVVLVGALAAIAVGATGAYFQNIKAGTVTGDSGSITVATSGGSTNGTGGQNFTWAHMLPAVPNTATVTCTNSGANNEDVYLVLDATTLTALNSLGTFGECHINATTGDLFDSVNMGFPALVADYKVGSNVAPGGTCWVSFEFNWGANYTNQTPVSLTLPYSMVATQVGIAPIMTQPNSP
jgi:hypothetical protein